MVVRIYFSICTALTLPIQLIVAQSLRRPIAAANPVPVTYSAGQNDVFSFVNNQAALAQIKHPVAGVYSESRFLLQATRFYTAAIALPSKMGNFGINLRYAGFRLFHEHQLGLAYARSLSDKVDIGIQFNYYGYRVPAYNNASTINVEIGSIVHLTNQLSMGMHVYNPLGGKFAKTGEALLSIYAVGLGYDASEKLFIGTEVVKTEDSPVNVQAVVQYRFVKQFFAKAGISSAPAMAFGGVAISWSNLRLYVGGNYHPVLGWSPGLSLILQMGKPAEPVVLTE